jgi:hypothetical protein
MTEDIALFASQPVLELMPGKRLRTWNINARHHGRQLLEVHDALDVLLSGAGVFVLTEAEYQLAYNLQRDVRKQLLLTFDPAGLEYWDECSDLLGVIEGISEATNETMLPIQPWAHITDNRGKPLADLTDALSWGHYVSLPGSAKYGDAAISEAFHTRLEEVRQ